jgi:hypothetical protein
MLNSDWLIKMLEKSGPTPTSRMLALFDILHDWISAPGIEAKPFTGGSPDKLLDYLRQQSMQASLPDPDGLAHQIYCIALGAMQAELNTPGGKALLQARQAVAILLRAQNKRPLARRAILSTLAPCLLVVFALTFQSGLFQQPGIVASPQLQSATQAHAQAGHRFNPDQIASLHYSLERIQQGVCQYPQALMLPPEQRAIFLENVVQGAVPADTRNMQEIRNLVQKVECYYPPVAMTAM